MEIIQEIFVKPQVKLKIGTKYTCQDLNETILPEGCMQGHLKTCKQTYSIHLFILHVYSKFQRQKPNLTYHKTIRNRNYSQHKGTKTKSKVSTFVKS